MRYDEPKGDWMQLPKLRSELPRHMRANVIARAGGIHTYDGGHLVRVDGRWEVLLSGFSNDADPVLNVLQKPS